MKKDFTQCKKELKNTVSSVKHFNKDFYKRYRNALQKTAENAENGIDDSYYNYNGLVKLYHSWDDVYNSRFYKENSCAYCEFLSIVCGIELV